MNLMYFKIFLIILIFTIIFFLKKKEHITFSASYMMQEYPKYNLDYDIEKKRFIHEI